MSSLYPSLAAARTRWILERRGPKNLLDPWKPYAHLWEEEFGPQGTLLPTLTILLTNRECPYRCLMCDLWQNTLDSRVPPGAIPAQIDLALKTSSPPALLETQRAQRDTQERMPTLPSPFREGGRGVRPAQIKLYNAGSFFDPQAIPPEDYGEIARRVAGFERVIVECHPALIGKRTLAFRDRLDGRELEVAIGLETVHPETLDRLNKRFTVDDFRRSADFLARNRIALRVFLLLRPPFMREAEGVEWAQRSLEGAFEAGANACCMIPTRGGNGAMEALAASGDYAPPSLRSLETAVEYGLSLGKGRVFADLWDIEKFADCACAPARIERLTAINRTQILPYVIDCPHCG